MDPISVYVKLKLTVSTVILLKPLVIQNYIHALRGLKEM
jgi:hypothetical protein